MGHFKIFIKKYTKNHLYFSIFTDSLNMVYSNCINFYKDDEDEKEIKNILLNEFNQKYKNFYIKCVNFIPEGLF